MKTALAASILLCLSACNQAAPVASVPPPEWTEPVAEPAVPAGDSDREVGSYIIELHDALSRANNKLRRLRDWATGMKD